MHETSPTLHEILAGRYVLKRELGRGGAATVFLAHDVRHERLVAIKVLHPELSNALGAQRFLREIKLTAGLQHPHILAIHDSGADDSQLWYVMPYVEGDSLRQRLAVDARLSIEEAVRIGREVAGALAYAHARGIVHRDIKPENILFSGGHAVLADFGIARAIDRAHDKVTGQGTITGTPAYMSPEQARARPFDGRSDVYSLACVLYEAIAGVPPFVADTPQAMLQQRVTSPPPPLRQYRHDAPPAIEAVIARALAISPDDRFADARAFSMALSAALDDADEASPPRPTWTPAWRTPWLWAAAVALFLSGGAAVSSDARRGTGAPAVDVDSTQYVVLPFTYADAETPPDDVEPVAQVVYSALGEWQGVHVTSEVAVLDALQRVRHRSLPEMQTVARSVHAGRLVWGRVWAEHDSLRVRIGLYDALAGAALREVTVTGPRDALLARDGGLRGAVADLLRDVDPEAIDPGADVGTRSLAAWRAYEEARHALEDWRVPDARAALQRAVAADPAFARPRVWLAQLQAWRDEPASDWTPHLVVAGQGRATLSRREALVADALASVSRGRIRESCSPYRTMRDADSLDAAAWLGLAYCQGVDRRVVRARGATGWAMAASLDAAEDAYERAVQIAPGSFAALSFGLVMQRLFPVETERIQRGYGPDSTLFVARLGLDHDTLVLVAHPWARLSRLPMQDLASRNHVAIARVRERLRGILTVLAQRRPDAPDVYESLALVLELRDEITGSPEGGYSALTALERARMVASDPVQRARIGAADIRLHLKLADFGRAAAIGDSILASAPGASGARAAHLAGIAALLGREREAVRYLRASGQSVSAGVVTDPPLVEEVSTALFVRTALGVCDDSVRVLLRRLDTLLESYVDPNRRPGARRDHFQRPLLLAADCLGPAAILAVDAPTIPLARVVQLLGRGDDRRARATLDSLQATRVSLRPGAYALDYTRTEAWVRAATGDTAAAIGQLDLSLTALPTLGPYLVYEPGMAAAVGRAMAYRAELAARSGDRGTAALWAGRVRTLWAHADHSLAPTMARMTELAAGRP